MVSKSACTRPALDELLLLLLWENKKCSFTGTTSRNQSVWIPEPQKLSCVTIAVSVFEESSSSMSSNLKWLDAGGHLYSPVTQKVCHFLKTCYRLRGKHISFPHHSAIQNVTSHGLNVYSFCLCFFSKPIHPRRFIHTPLYRGSFSCLFPALWLEFFFDWETLDGSD